MIKPWLLPVRLSVVEISGPEVKQQAAEEEAPNPNLLWSSDHMTPISLSSWQTRSWAQTLIDFWEENVLRLQRIDNLPSPFAWNNLTLSWVDWLSSGCSINEMISTRGCCLSILIMISLHASKIDYDSGATGNETNIQLILDRAGWSWQHKKLIHSSHTHTALLQINLLLLLNLFETNKNYYICRHADGKLEQEQQSSISARGH